MTQAPKIISDIPAGIKTGEMFKSDGVTYVAGEHFSQGADAKQSNYTVFGFTNRGVFGLTEVVMGDD